jgi:hypothetical protein
LRKKAVTWAIGEKNYSQRRACRLVGLHPKTYRYASTRPDDSALRTKLKELASQRRRFGYRRLGLLLVRAGIKLNHKKLYRLYKEERLTVRRRGGRKRALGTRAPMVIQQGQNLRWSIDFVANTFAAGRRFRKVKTQTRISAAYPALDAGRNTPRHCALRPLVAPARACGAYRHETRGRHRPPRSPSE